MHNSRLEILRTRGAMVLGLALLVAGCATMRWEHPKKTAQMLEQDQQECEVQARAHVPRPVAPPPVVNLTGLAAIVRMIDESSIDRQHAADISQAVQRCLQEKGWTLKRD